MSGTRVTLLRMATIGVALGLALLLLTAREASAAKYSVAQCGWHVGADASWSDTTGGVKFRPDTWCVPPAGANPFDGVHVKSFTRGGQSTVSGNRYAGWRWHAPPTTGITRVSGTWWQALHDGMQQRLGSVTHAGFHPFATAASTNTALREFGAGFATPVPAFEDRLLCARATDKWCSLASTSWSSLRALTLVVQDDTAPGRAIGGALTAGGWRKGAQAISFSASDAGAGVRFGETLLGGARVVLHEYPCAKAMIGGEWRGTQMQPCATSGSAAATIDTTRFSDGPHTLSHCATDFAGNVSCTGGVTVQIDNNPPAHPRSAALAGGEEWRRVNDFDLTWVNPDQGKASPIGAALWQIVGPGYDSGVGVASGRGIAALADRTVPAAGAYTLRLWLRDEAGNQAPSSAVELPLRLDDIAPGLAFEPAPEGGAAPRVVRADVHDAHSGPLSGEIAYRRLGQPDWRELSSKLVAGAAGSGAATISASLPERLEPGTYVFRAEAVDRAGNRAVASRRADGTEMAVRVVAPPAEPNRARRPAAAAAGAGTVKTRLFARLRRGARQGTQLTVPFGARAVLGGRLVSVAGAGLAGRTLRVVTRPSRGALRGRRVDLVRTGRAGGFSLRLPAGASRRVTVSFAGSGSQAPSRRPGLLLRVRSALTLSASPRSLRTGEAVRFQGRVRARGAAIPRRGKLVAVQYYESAAGRWRPVLVTRTDHAGRFRARYRFRYVSGSARIRLRAVALAEELWPYAPGPSPATTVTVTG